MANLNGPAQTVIAGDKGAIDRAVALARARGARKATLLAVSAPFHSPLMRPAREGMTPLLEAADFRDPRLPVVTNVDAAPVTTGAAARDALIRQIDSPVRWVESILWMEDALGVETFVEVGPGNVLSGMNRRIVRAARGDRGSRIPIISGSCWPRRRQTDVEARRQDRAGDRRVAGDRRGDREAARPPGRAGWCWRPATRRS